MQILGDKIKSVKLKSYKGMLYNLSVQNTENYFANGILVHNCSYNCAYCFSFVFKQNNPSVKGKGLRCVNDERVARLMRGDERIQNEQLYQHFFKKKFILHWGGLADPFCRFEWKKGVGKKIIEAAVKEDYPILFSTKGDVTAHKDYLSIFKNATKRNFAFQFSIIVHTDELSRKIEPNTPTTTERLKAIEKLAAMGYYVILRFRPFIVGLSSKGYMKLIQDAYNAGARGISTEFYAFDARCSNPVRLNNLIKVIEEESGFTKYIEYYKKLSPHERGNYYRLNRDVKERFIKDMYKFCVKNKMVFACSDPDFKELGMTESCCGMPNPELAKKFGIKLNENLFNWTPNQLTGKIIDLRRKYWKGIYETITVDDVIKVKEDTYLTDQRFSKDHPRTFACSQSVTKSLSFRDIFVSEWNRLFPYHYFHGKLKPCGIVNENYIYKYEPSSYEYAWQEEGMDLTK